VDIANEELVSALIIRCFRNRVKIW